MHPRWCGTKIRKELGKVVYRPEKQGFTAAKIFVNGNDKSLRDGRDEYFSGRIGMELEKVKICRKQWDMISTLSWKHTAE